MLTYENVYINIALPEEIKVRKKMKYNNLRERKK